MLCRIPQILLVSVAISWLCGLLFSPRADQRTLRARQRFLEKRWRNQGRDGDLVQWSKWAGRRRVGLQLTGWQFRR